MASNYRRRSFQELTAKIEGTLHDEQVAITLDGSSKEYSVSKAMLCKASDYFRKALDGQFKEASTHTLRLPGCDESGFRLLVYYMDQGDLPDFYNETFSDDDSPSWSGEDFRRHPEIQLALARLWFIGQAYLLPKLQNVAMKRFLDFLKGDMILHETVRLVFEESRDGCPLRDVCVRQAVADCHMHLQDEDLDSLSSVPRFFALFTRQSWYCKGGDGCEHDPNCTPSHRFSYEEFFVAEE